MNLDQKSSLKACLEEEKENPRMKNYVKILDTPNISAFEWIHRVQEELMDATLYLEKLKQINGDDEKLSDSTIDGSQNTCVIS